MKMDREKRATSDLLEKVVSETQNDYITVGELRNSLHERGFGVLLAVCDLPLCIPAPAPLGFLAIPIFILAIQMIAGMDSPWIPEWIARKQIPRKNLAYLVAKGAPFLRKIETLIKPRMEFLCSKTGEKSIGIFAFLFGISIAFPLPLSNFIPALGILVMSLGLLGKDGLTIIIGKLIGIAGLVVTTTVLILGVGALEKIASYF